jgi:3D (Asp-Asp-Asp) domain-containing protein
MNWKITQIKKLNNPLEGTVVNASYSVTDGTSTIASDLNLLPANADLFVAFNDITEEQVISWVKDALNANDIEGDISGAEKIEALVSLKTSTPTPQITPLPWEK